MSRHLPALRPAGALGLALGLGLALTTHGALAGQSGEKVYKTFCQSCHMTGVAGAPKMVPEDWEARLEKGEETLYENAKAGVGAHPPKGTCMACSDKELKAAVDYMLEQVR